MYFNDRISKFSSLLQVLVDAPVIAFINLKPADLPTKPGVYRIFETDDELPATIYVGESENLSNRIYGNHLMGNTEASTLKKKLVKSGKFTDTKAVKEFLRAECSLQYVVLLEQKERIMFEHYAVAMLEPRFND
jgi:excinuclease UvrABC nuclease subunit